MEIIRAGRTLLLLLHKIPQSKPHLWFVLTDPTEKLPEVVAVMVRTLRSFTDKTVILDVCDHPFIKHPSSVHYSTATFFRVDAIQRAIQCRQCHLKEDMSEGLLQRVRQGLFDSHFTVNAIRDYCREFF